MKKIVEDKFWIIGSIKPNGTLSFAANPVKQETEAAARREVERLARKQPDKTFIYFESKAKCRVREIEWN